MIDKYLHLIKELRNLWNMKVTVISIVANELKTTSLYLEYKKEELVITGRIESIQTSTLSSTESLKRILEILRNVLLLKKQREITR